MLAVVLGRPSWSFLYRSSRTAFSDHDFSMRILPVDQYFQRHVPGATGQRHVTIRDAGRYLQEDKPAEVAAEINAFVTENPTI